MNNNNKISQYFLLEEVGKGSHGIVYKAYHQNRPSENLAVKVIEDTGNLDTLLIEPQLLSRLNHHHIVSLKDYFLYGSNLVLVTEYIDGVNLDEYLKQRGRLTEEEVIIFLSQMADALIQAHNNNIIHRDIKLSNILVTGSGENIRFVLVDFGVSRMTEGIQMIKRVAGTYYYMAPEQLRGRPCEQSDLWALGVCAYTLLTGIKPFKADTKDELFNQVLLSVPQAPSNHLGGINFKLETIILKLLERELINRTNSANDLKESLKEISALNIKQFNFERRSNYISTREEQDKAELYKIWEMFWLFFVLSEFMSVLWNLFMLSIPGIIIYIVQNVICILGVIRFYLGQKEKILSDTIIGIVLIIISVVINWTFTFVHLDMKLFTRRIEAIKQINPLIPEYFALIGAIFIIGFVLSIYFMFKSLDYLAKTIPLQESLVLHKVLKKSSTNPGKIITILKRFVDINWLNINIKQKYIEMLLLNGQIKEAIVEAKLTITIDPYNFGINLLLAKGYFEAGLYEESIQVCNNYLAICNYSFEFEDIKNQCENMLREV